MKQVDIDNGIVTTTWSRTTGGIKYKTLGLEGSKCYVYVDSDNVPTTMEHEINGEIGDLWFEGKLLVDYDGCYEIPQDILTLLEKLEYDVSRY
jgi:hypothetical protein